MESFQLFGLDTYEPGCQLSVLGMQALKNNILVAWRRNDLKPLQPRDIVRI